MSTSSLASLLLPVVLLVALLVPGGPATAAVEVETVASGLTHPWAITFTDDGRTFFTQRDAGTVSELVDGQSQVVHQFDVDPDGEGGLLGLVASPDFVEDGWLYAYLTTAADNRIVRFRPGGTVETLLTSIPSGTIHDGGRLRFGPDGMLYAGTGDAGTAGNAQDPSSLAGKILRLAPDGSVPDGNPFADSPVWTLGHRNVQGLAWDASGRMFATELGPDRDDEVNHVVAGDNYGWPVVTGRSGDDGYTDPIFVRQPPEASWSGATVLSEEAQVPGAGDLLVGALRGERLWRVSLDGAQVVDATQEYVEEFGRLRDVVEAPDGSVWLLTTNGGGADRILRLAIARDPRIATACPEGEIADAGFTDVADSSVHDAAIDCLAHYGVVDGIGDGRYAPGRSVNRAEAASLAARLLEVAGVELPEPDGTSFDDVDPDGVHADAIDQMHQLEVMEGYDTTTFRPGRAANRGQAASILVRAYTAMTGQQLPAGEDAFGDEDGSVHEDDINAAAAAGITTGRGPDTYAPAAEVSRAEAASLFARTLDVAMVREGVEPSSR